MSARGLGERKPCADVGEQPALIELGPDAVLCKPVDLHH